MARQIVEPQPDPMAYLIFDVTNENDSWEAEVYGSRNGVDPSTKSFHLMLGSGADLKVMNAITAMEMIGWAVADQRKIDEPFIWQQGEGARSIITSANEKTEVVVNVSAGGFSIQETLPILQQGADKRQGGTDE